MSGYRRPRMSAGLYLSEKSAPYVAPWLLALAAMPVAVLVHFTIGSDTQWMIIVGVLFTLMTLGTWLTWKNRKHETRLTATLLTGALLGWVALAGAGVPWRGDLLRAWAIGGVCGSVFWCLRHAGTVAGHERDRVEKQEGSWLAKKIAAFKDSKVDTVKETPDELRIRTTLSAPTTVADAQSTRDQIAAVAQVNKNQVKVLRVPDKDGGHEGRADIVFTRGTDTSVPVAYRGPSAAGQSCAAAPLYLGRRTNGSDILWWMSGSTDPKNPRAVGHTKVSGITGSGKTETICTAILDMRWRTDIVPVVADPAKFRQSFGDIEECLGLAATTHEQVVQLIENLSGPVVEYRSELLGSLVRSDGGVGYKQWEPECYTLHGVPFLFIDIEEAADVLMERDEEVDAAARKLRSLGIKLVISMQTWPHDNIPRKTRGQLSESLAHGQNEFQDAKYALSAESLDAHADPTKWKNDAPGSLYAELLGTGRAHWPVDGRAVYMTPAEKQMSLTGSRQYWAEIDPGTYERLAYGLFDAPIVDADDDEEEVADVASTQDDIDPTVPLEPPAFNIQFSDAPRPAELSTEQARARLTHRLEVLARSGQTDVTYDDLADIPAEVGRSSAWVYEQLNKLVELGVLREYKPPKGKKIFTITRQYPEASAS